MTDGYQTDAADKAAAAPAVAGDGAIHPAEAAGQERAVSERRTVTIVTTDQRTGKRRVRTFQASTGRPSAAAPEPSRSPVVGLLVGVGLAVAATVGVWLWTRRRGAIEAPAAPVVPVMQMAPTRWEIS